MKNMKRLKYFNFLKKKLSKQYLKMNKRINNFLWFNLLNI